MLLAYTNDSFNDIVRLILEQPDHFLVQYTNLSVELMYASCSCSFFLSVLESQALLDIFSNTVWYQDDFLAWSLAYMIDFDAYTDIPAECMTSPNYYNKRWYPLLSILYAIIKCD